MRRRFSAAISSDQRNPPAINTGDSAAAKMISKRMRRESRREGELRSVAADGSPGACRESFRLFENIVESLFGRDVVVIGSLRPRFR